jgi:hypothetical protein
MKFQKSAIAALASLGLLNALAPIARAQEAVVAETVRVTHFLNGGIGQDEQARMKRLASEFPLRMTFSERKDGEFLADIPVLITDARGNPVFDLPHAGPMLDVALPPGKYKVSARFNGLTESQEVTVGGKEGKDLYFHWRGEPKS